MPTSATARHLAAVPSPAAGRPTAETPVRCAVVGAGYWGPNLIRNLASNPRTEVAWVCDRDRDRASKAVGRHSTIAVTEVFDLVLDDPSVEAVAIATPAATHAALAEQALRAGKHVLVEKPLALTSDDGRRLVALADELGLVLMCDHTFCYTPAAQAIRQMIQSGKLGEIQFVDTERINLGLVQPDADVFWDLAPHDISLLEFLLPDGCAPLTVSAHAGDPLDTGKACIGYLVMELPGKAIAHTHVNWLSPTKVRRVLIGGSRRMLLWDDMNPAQRVTVFDKGIDLATVGGGATPDRRISYRSGDLVAPALRETEALSNVATELAECVRSGRPSQTSGRSGVRVLDVLEAAGRSLALDGAAVTLEGSW